MSVGLTNRQADCLQAIRVLTVDGVPPSLDELAEAMDFESKSSVQRVLVKLRERGKVDWKPRQARSLVIIEDQVSPAVLDGLSDEALRGVIAIASGLLAQREGGPAAQAVLNRIAQRLPGAPRGISA
jgi:SOS-response transcriptional repressor LexA